MATEPTTVAESHWNHADPAAQPDRDEVAGVGRMICESRARQGDKATQDAVLAELRDLGVRVTAEQVNHFWQC